jgi:hypothetical protein
MTTPYYRELKYAPSTPHVLSAPTSMIGLVHALIRSCIERTGSKGIEVYDVEPQGVLVKWPKNRAVRIQTWDDIRSQLHIVIQSTAEGRVERAVKLSVDDATIVDQCVRNTGAPFGSVVSFDPKYAEWNVTTKNNVVLRRRLPWSCDGVATAAVERVLLQFEAEAVESLPDPADDSDWKEHLDARKVEDGVYVLEWASSRWPVNVERTKTAWRLSHGSFEETAEWKDDRGEYNAIVTALHRLMERAEESRAWTLDSVVFVLDSKEPDWLRASVTVSDKPGTIAVVFLEDGHRRRKGERAMISERWRLSPRRRSTRREEPMVGDMVHSDDGHVGVLVRLHPKYTLVPYGHVCDPLAWKTDRVEADRIQPFGTIQPPRPPPKPHVLDTPLLSSLQHALGITTLQTDNGSVTLTVRGDGKTVPGRVHFAAGFPHAPVRVETHDGKVNHLLHSSALVREVTDALRRDDPAGAVSMDEMNQVFAIMIQGIEAMIAYASRHADPAVVEAMKAKARAVDWNEIRRESMDEESKTFMREVLRRWNNLGRKVQWFPPSQFGLEGIDWRTVFPNDDSKKQIAELAAMGLLTYEELEDLVNAKTQQKPVPSGRTPKRQIPTPSAPDKEPERQIPTPSAPEPQTSLAEQPSAAAASKPRESENKDSTQAATTSGRFVVGLCSFF